MPPARRRASSPTSILLWARSVMRWCYFFVINALIALVSIGLYETGAIRFNYPSPTRFPIAGIDVSRHQGNIDWAAVRNSGQAFAFIKATEGGDHQDSHFLRNWSEAATAGLARAAYHFFTFCTDGAMQAHNLIAIVPPPGGDLPLVVDIEFSGNCRRWRSIAAIRADLKKFLAVVETTYKQRPILYVTKESYRRIVRRHFSGYPIWVRDILFEPSATRYPEWLFWQYANNGRVPGVTGPVDLNVFRGSRVVFERLLKRDGNTLSADIISLKTISR
jgi:lysozyme